MNRFIGCLSIICRENLLVEKWLIAPSLRVGYQWLESVARSGQPVINVRVQTLKGMAIELAGPEMAKKTLTLITPTAGAFIIDSIWNRLPAKATGYLSKLDRSPTLSQTIYGSLNALRLAGLKTEELRPDSFEVESKGNDLRVLVREYLGQLSSRNLVDYADVLRMAITRVQGDLFALAENVLVLVPEDAGSVGLEKQLRRSIPDERLRSIAVDPLESPNAGENDVGLLSWVLNPAAARNPKNDRTVEIFQAIGEANEAREVLRRCLDGGQSLDRVEILYTDTATYVPLLYEIARRFQTDAGPLEEGIPITFAEGIPASYSRPGRSLTAWLNWMKDNYPQPALVRMLQDGLLQVRGMKEAEFSFSGLAGLLRSIGIGFGRDRYVAKIDEQIAAATRQLNQAPGTRNEDDDLNSQRTAAIERRLRGLKLLGELISTLLEISQPPAAASQGILDRARQFLSQFGRRVSEQDNYAKDVLLNQIEEMKRWSELVGEHMSLDLSNWLTALPAQLRILGSGPKEGCLHVAHVLTGGHSGRPHTYILGLDDSRFPGPALQDPILLDTERKKLSAELPTAVGTLNDTLQRFARMLAGLRGHATLSFSCRDLADDRDMFPSSTLLSIFRIISGQKNGDQSDFLKWLAPAASFAPDAPGKCLDEGEWWLWRLCGSEEVSNARQAVLNRFPHLARGWHAIGQRDSDQFTAFDGHVPTAGMDLNPLQSDGLVVSASMLETAGRCPLAFFFRHALRIRPLDELALDQDRWLDPMAFGSLLHEVFRRFMTQLRSEHKLPDFDRDVEILIEVLTQEIHRYRDLYPPANESSYRSQCRQLNRAVRIFLKIEHDFCRHSSPLFLEASIGIPAETGGGTPLDEAEPVELAIAPGQSVRVRGRIDRIDRVGDERSSAFSIWDYKTGSSTRFEGSDPFASGRIIQHVLYVAMVQNLLRHKIDPKASVQSFGYFFPGKRGLGQRIEWTQQQLNEGQAIVQRLCDTIARGTFLATDDKDDCSFCDYQAVCGDIVALTQRSNAKLERLETVELKSFRELRRND